MLRHFPLVIAIVWSIAVPIAAAAEPAAGETGHAEAGAGKPEGKAVRKAVHARRHVEHWKGYGFLPGYRPPEDRYRYQGYWSHEPQWWWYGGPRFYRGRWNGGGFGPCWRPTPIGPMWTCG